MKNLFLTLGLSVALPLHAWAADASVTPLTSKTSAAQPVPNEVKNPAKPEETKDPLSAQNPTPRQSSDKEFNRKDFNDDGKITPYEYTLYSKARFAKFDKDANGYSTPEEYYRVFKDTPGTPEKPSTSELVFAIEDTDKDGKITQYECLSNASETFKKIDTNKDDLIDSDEFFAYRQKNAGKSAKGLK